NEAIFQEQIHRRITTDSQLWKDDQLRATFPGPTREVKNLGYVCFDVANSRVYLGQCYFHVRGPRMVSPFIVWLHRPGRNHSAPCKKNCEMSGRLVAGYLDVPPQKPFSTLQEKRRNFWQAGRRSGCAPTETF